MPYDKGREERKQIAQQVLQVIKDGAFTSWDGTHVVLQVDRGRGNLDDVELYPPERLAALVGEERLGRLAAHNRTNKKCKFYLEQCSSFAASPIEKYAENKASWYDEGNSKNYILPPLVMNFANAHCPGGGFLSGAHAQEECLCRESTLYASIGSPKAHAMYDYNNCLNAPVDSDYMLLSPNVLYFRNDDYGLFPCTFNVAVGTVAAPNVRCAAKYVPKERLNAAIRNRLRAYLCMAAENRYKTLVLGAWGCGAFGNAPDAVAQIFYELFFSEGFEDYFETIVFAILDNGKNWDAFRRVFADKVSDNSVAEEREQRHTYMLLTKPFPVCNHVRDVSSANKGFVQGVLEDGTPFEAELWMNEKREYVVSFIIPNMNWRIQKSPEEIAEDQRNRGLQAVTDNISWSGKPVRDGGILDIGMVACAAYDEVPFETLRSVVDYLEMKELVSFTTDIREASAQILTDADGHAVVQVLIPLIRDGREIAKTPLSFRPFLGMRDEEKSKNPFQIIYGGK